ncbi:MAG: ATP-dependent helicase, partial [Prevotella sp.]|nr:ATP-dependent helicase [Prevotella sp.]
RYGQQKTPIIYYLVANSDNEDLRSDFTIIDKLRKKEEEVHKTLGDAMSVMELYNVRSEEDETKKALRTGDENFLTPQATQRRRRPGFRRADAIVTTTPKVEGQYNEIFEETFSLYADDMAYYRELFRHLEEIGSVDRGDIIIHDDSQPPYVEIRNCDEFSEVVKAIPREGIPRNGLFKLTTDKPMLAWSIAESRKSKDGEWSRILPLYDLHPIIQYLQTKFTASTSKTQAFVVRGTQLPKGISYYLFYGSCCNGLGQSLVSKFFVVAVDKEGVMRERPVSFHDFALKYSIIGQNVFMKGTTSKEDISILMKNLKFAIEIGTVDYMYDEQNHVSMEMDKQLKNYKDKLVKWAGKANTFLDNAENVTLYRQSYIEKEKKEIQKITDQSSQFYKDMFSLENVDPYIRLLAVFHNL